MLFLWILRDFQKHLYWKTSATLLKVTILHGCFLCFLNCTNGIKSRKASQIISKYLEYLTSLVTKSLLGRSMSSAEVMFSRTFLSLSLNKINANTNLNWGDELSLCNGYLKEMNEEILKYFKDLIPCQYVLKWAIL